MSKIHMVGTAWLFCVANKYYVVHGFDDDLCDLSENAIAIDELIAEPLVLLCNKGYITEYSCSGHPYKDCSYNVIEDDKETINEKDYVAVTKFCGTDTIAVCNIDSEMEDEIYIAFNKDYNFPRLPKGWEYSNSAIRTRVSGETATEFYKKSINMIEILVNWIKELPTLN